MGGRVITPGTMNIAQVIYVERSVTPVIIAIFQEWTVCFFCKKQNIF
jgi:hypothetical protein